jgi:nucleoside 2-deoxyribosyltransferase
VDIKKQLIVLGHQPLIDERTERLARWEAPELEALIKSEHSEAKKQHNFIKMYYDFIAESDAIIVCNFEKRWIKDYIGSNTFLELGYAHVLGKKIFLLNNIPDQPYIIDELKAMQPIILNWDLSQIT